MNRLTKRNSDGSVGISQFRYYNYDDFQEIAQKLAEYEDLEEKGLLLKLPCKIGDWMYDISLKSNIITPVRINEILMYKLHNVFKPYDNTYSYQYNCCTFDAHGDVYEEYEIDANDINKTVFLTKEEAKKELNRLENVK